MIPFKYEYLWYDTEGAIKEWSSSTHEPPDDLYAPRLTRMEVASPKQYLGTHYVENGELVPIKSMTPTITGTTISGLPIPCTVKSNGGEWVIDDGSAELNYVNPGTYQVSITALHYYPYTCTVTA